MPRAKWIWWLSIRLHIPIPIFDIIGMVIECRSTAFGIQAVFGRIGAIAGNLSFGKLISLDPMIPIVLVAALLLSGAIAAAFMPSPPGEGVWQNFKSVRRKLKWCVGCICRPFHKTLRVQNQ